MRCAICKHGETHPGTTSVTLERGETTVVIRDVPAEICENCGEYYLSEEVARTVERLSGEAVSRHAEIEVLRYAA